MLLSKKKLILSIIILFSLAGTSYWYFKKNKKLPQTPFKTEKPIKRDIVQYVNSSGTLKAKDQITIGSLIAGRVDKILVENNDLVKKDQVLAILDNGKGDSSVKDLQAKLEEAKANLEYQEKSYARQKELYKSGQLSKDLYEKYTRDLLVLKSKVEQITQELDIQTKEYNNLFIKSPDNGIIIAKEIDLGQMVTAQLQATVLFTIAKDLHIMEASVDVDEADVGMVKAGQDATFTVDAFPKKIFNAKVKKIRYLAKTVNNVVTYETVLSVDNPNLELRPGMTTNVDIKVAEAKNVLTVPNKTLRIDVKDLEAIAKLLSYNCEKYVNTNPKTEIDTIWIFENKSFKQIKVTLGAKEGIFTQIISDEINENSEIITEVTEINRENVVGQIFKQPGGLGK